MKRVNDIVFPISTFFFTLIIYKTIICFKIEYASSAWMWGTPPTSLSKLDVTQRKTMEIGTKSTS